MLVNTENGLGTASDEAMPALDQEDFGLGDGLTPAVAAAVERVAKKVVRELADTAPT